MTKTVTAAAIEKDIATMKPAEMSPVSRGILEQSSVFYDPALLSNDQGRSEAAARELAREYFRES